MYILSKKIFSIEYSKIEYTQFLNYNSILSTHSIIFWIALKNNRHSEATIYNGRTYQLSWQKRWCKVGAATSKHIVVLAKAFLDKFVPFYGGKKFNSTRIKKNWFTVIGFYLPLQITNVFIRMKFSQATHFLKIRRFQYYSTRKYIIQQASFSVQFVSFFYNFHIFKRTDHS